MTIFTFLWLIFAVFITVSIIYSSVKLGISPMPSSNKAYLVVMKLIEETGSGAIVDLGSGWGNMVIRIAKKYPQRQVVGYELSILPWLISKLLKKILGLKNLTIHRKDFYQANFSKSTVLICYLFPAAMEKIKHKLLLEQPKIGFVISNNFALPSWQPDKVIQLSDFYKSPVYFYKM